MGVTVEWCQVRDEKKLTVMWKGLILSVFFAVFIKTSVAQDCSFYHPNSSELYISAFFGVPENVSVGTVIARADARIALRINLTAEENNEVAILLFGIIIRDNTSVEVVVRKPLNKLLPVTKSLYFKLECTGPSGTYSPLPFLITIQDVNDHAPAFESDSYQTQISEFHNIGQPLSLRLKAFDGDLPNTPNTELHYSIAESADSGYFVIRNPLEPVITLSRKLDYETGPKNFLLNVTVSDRGSPPLTNWTEIQINVQDEDDQNPVFSQHLYEATIVEELDEFKPVVKVQAWDGDLGQNKTLKYEITDGSRAFVDNFIIDQVTGTISLLKSVDREALPASYMGFITLCVQASQTDDISRTASATVKIFVEDINDNGPKFLEKQVTKQIDLLPSVLDLKSLDLIHLTISDLDTKENSGFRVFVKTLGHHIANATTGLLVLDPSEGVNQVVVLRALNISSILSQLGSDFMIKIIAVDSTRNKRELMKSRSGSDELSDSATVHLKFNYLPGSASDLNLPADAAAFMSQYPATLLIIFGSFICLLLLVIVIMAGAYHNLRKQRQVHPFSVAGSTRSSVTVSPISLLTTDTESQA